MKTLPKTTAIIAVLAVTTLVSTATAVSLIYTLNTPATLTINDPGLLLYAADCTTPIASLTFTGSSSVETCLIPGGTASSEYIDSNSITSTLPASAGTLTYTIVQKQGLNQLSPPIQLVPGNSGSTMFINFTLTTASGATSQPFTVSISVYSG